MFDSSEAAIVVSPWVLRNVLSPNFGDAVVASNGILLIQACNCGCSTSTVADLNLSVSSETKLSLSLFGGGFGQEPIPKIT